MTSTRLVSSTSIDWAGEHEQGGHGRGELGRDQPLPMAHPRPLLGQVRGVMLLGGRIVEVIGRCCGEFRCQGQSCCLFHGQDKPRLEHGWSRPLCLSLVSARSKYLQRTSHGRCLLCTLVFGVRQSRGIARDWLPSLPVLGSQLGGIPSAVSTLFDLFSAPPATPLFAVCSTVNIVVSKFPSESVTASSISWPGQIRSFVG